MTLNLAKGNWDVETFETIEFERKAPKGEIETWTAIDWGSLSELIYVELHGWEWEEEVQCECGSLGPCWQRQDKPRQAFQSFWIMNSDRLYCLHYLNQKLAARCFWPLMQHGSQSVARLSLMWLWWRLWVSGINICRLQCAILKQILAYHSRRYVMQRAQHLGQWAWGSSISTFTFFQDQVSSALADHRPINFNVNPANLSW